MVLLGHSIAEQLFGYEDPLGKEVRMFGRKLMVIGVLKKYGFNYNFGMSEAIIVNTKGELLTNEVYYLVRIVSWEIEDEIVYPDLGRDEKGFSLEAYTNSDKDILLSSKYKYMEAFMVSENLKEKILDNFSLPFLYSLEEWKELNNSDFYWD